MAATRALVMAGGADRKWTELGGEGRRHLQVVAGERVLDRIVRQLRERGVRDVGVIAPPGDDRYDVPGTFRVDPDTDEWGLETLNGRAHWLDRGRTLLVYGDVVFGDRAMDRVARYARRRLMVFGRDDRFGEGPLGGEPGGELFAVSLWPEHRAVWVAALEEAARLRDVGVISRVGSWEAYRIVGGARGADVALHRHYPAAFTNLRDGLTDDFDTPWQWEGLCALHEGRERSWT